MRNSLTGKTDVIQTGTNSEGFARLLSNDCLSRLASASSTEQLSWDVSKLAYSLCYEFIVLFFEVIRSGHSSVITNQRRA